MPRPRSPRTGRGAGGCSSGDLPAGHRVKGDDAFRILREIGAYTPNGDEEYIDLEDHEFLAAVGVPEEWRNEPELWDGWTAENVRCGVDVIADDNQMTVAELMMRTVRGADQAAMAEKQKGIRLEAELPQLTTKNADAEHVARSHALLPSADVADKVMRYESHLNKQLTQTLHLLERLRAIRDGNPPLPPAALDVTVETGGLPLPTG